MFTECRDMALSRNVAASAGEEHGRAGVMEEALQRSQDH